METKKEKIEAMAQEFLSKKRRDGWNSETQRDFFNRDSIKKMLVDFHFEASKKKLKFISDDDFCKVTSLIESGFTICKALDKIGIDRNIFYNRMTPQQKLELTFKKTLNAKVGTVYKQ